MNACHGPSLRLLRYFFRSLVDMGTGRVLEVAAGDGRVTKDLLRDKYKAIDCFDQCPIAVRKLEAL